jgi:hypothetical protein
MPSIWEKNQGIYLGFEAKATQGDAPPMNNPIRYKRDRHIVTIGPNGSG